MSFGIQKNLDSGGVAASIKAMQTEASDETKVIQSAKQESTADSLKEQLSEMVNPFAAMRKVEKKVKSQKGRIQKMLQSGEKTSRLAPISPHKGLADEFHSRNPELLSKKLTDLRDEIKPDDTKEELLKKITRAYPDVSLRDEALEFLILTSDGELAHKLNEIKNELKQDFGREIVAGKNIHIQAREASAKDPTGMRDLYRNVTGDPMDAPTLFDKLANQYGYKELKKVIDFLLHAMGADMNAKGPSIDRAELQRLFSEVRNIQAILGVYRFFSSRMKLMKYLFEENHMEMPRELTFETMAKTFNSLVGERFPSADKVNQKAEGLGLESSNVIGKIITFSQFRDAVREVSLGKIYKTVQQRDDINLAILECLEDCEEDLENVGNEDKLDEKER